MRVYKIIDLTGQRFGRLVVICFIERIMDRKKPKTLWLCKCDCGAEKKMSTHSLRTIKTKSCGCQQIEFMKSRTIHGDCINNKQSSEYSIWHSMIKRCTKPNTTGYHNYGGRGITVCDRWLGEKGYINFLEDMGRKPTPKHSLDRIDNNKGYSKENCRWATRDEQGNNRRNNVPVKYKDEIKNLAQWEVEYGLSKGVLRHRLKAGWGMEKSLSTPINNHYKSVKP